MIAAETDDSGLHVSLKFQDHVHATLGVGAPVEIVAEEDDGVALADFASDLAKQVVECRQIAMAVADRDGGHTLQLHEGPVPTPTSSIR